MGQYAFFVSSLLVGLCLASILWVAAAADTQQHSSRRQLLYTSIPSIDLGPIDISSWLFSLQGIFSSTSNQLIDNIFAG